MRVGFDGKYGPGVEKLKWVHAPGLDGAFFRRPSGFSETLDPGAIRAGRALADELGLYLELGVGRVNPYTPDKNPEIFAAGDGDYRRGFERMMRACVEAGCTTATAGSPCSGRTSMVGAPQEVQSSR